MIQITADTRRAVVTNKELLTTGSAGIQVQFTLSEDWAGLAKVAVFRQGDEGEKVDCVLDSGLTCVVPPEVLTTADEVVFCGIYGSNGQGTIIIPTIWASLGVVRPGTEPNTPASATPTPEIWAQILSVAQDAEATADEAMSLVETGLNDLAVLETMVESAEASRVLAEQSRVTAENQRVSTENNRVSAENTRVVNENARDSAETARNTAEQSRAAAENARASAETARASAELERVAAEQYREEKYAEYVETVSEYADNANASATAAAGSASDAATSAGTATTSAGQAASSATAAATSASQASSSAASATQSATSAQAQASAAAGSASAASGSAGRAATSEQNASASAGAAASSAAAAETAQDAAETAQAAAEDAADSVSASAAQIAQNASDISDLTRQISDIEENQIPDLKESLTETQNRIYEKQEGENLLNPDLESVGSLKSDGEIDTTATSYSTSDFIELEANENYTFTNYNGTTGLIATSRKYVALYDANKQFISGSYQNVNNANHVAFSSGENAKYVRVSSTASNYKFVKKGDTAPSTFVEYEEPEYINKLDFADKSIPESAINYESDYIKKENINLYDSSEDVVGLISRGGGIDTSETRYKTTGFVKVKDGFSYTISPRCRVICVFDSDKTPVPAQYDNVEKTAPFDFVALNDGYIRISYNINYGMDSVESSYNGLLTRKTEEGIALSNTQLKQVRETAFAPNILWGKKWAVCGDSFTNDGGTGTTIQDGKYAGKSYTYPWIIGNRQNMDIVQFFGGGRTLAFPAEPGSFVNSLTCPTQNFYYQNIPADTDYITIYLGINDDHHRTGGGDGEDPTGVIPLGTVDDTTTATYLGAWNVVLTWLITNRPNAHIGIIVTNGIANNDNYRLGQIAIAEKYGIPYIDLNGDTRTPAMLRTSNPNIPAAVKTALIAKWAVNPGVNEHPNDAAQLFESTFIENFLRSL